MTTPSHETLREALLDLSYGELGRLQARALRRHLAGCSACREELARLEATRGALSGLAPQAAPARGEAVLLAAARQAAEARRPRPFVPSWVWGASVSAVAVAAVAVLSLRQASTLRPPAAPPADTELVARAPQPAARPAEPSANAGASADAAAPGAASSAAGEGKPEATGKLEAQGKQEARREEAAAAQPPRPVPAPALQAPARRKAAAGAAPPAAERKAFPVEPPAPMAERELRRAPAPTAPERAATQDQARSDLAPQKAEAPALRERDAVASASPPAPAEEREGAVGGAAQGGARGSPEDSSEAKAEPAPAPPPAAARSERPQALAKGRATAAGPEDAIARHARLRAAGRLRSASVSFPTCPGEAAREVEQDQAGRVVKLTRRGTAQGAPYQAELFYGEDGELGAVRYQAGGVVRELRLGPTGADAGGAAQAGIPAAALEPRRASEAGPGAPPRCGG